MLREEYLTAQNINQKAGEWLNKLAEFSRGRACDFGRCALLVIDMQNFFLDRRSHAHVPSAKALIPNIKRMIAAFRENSLPVVFTRFSLEKDDNGTMARWWDDRLVEGSEESRITDGLEVDGDTIIVLRKKKYSAFRGTPLRSILKEGNINTVVITGVMSHLCCDTTARDAFMDEFNVCFVIDATASYNEDLHLSSLKALSHGFVTPMRTGDLIERIKNR